MTQQELLHNKRFHCLLSKPSLRCLLHCYFLGGETYHRGSSTENDIISLSTTKLSLDSKRWTKETSGSFSITVSPHLNPLQSYHNPCLEKRPFNGKEIKTLKEK